MSEVRPLRAYAEVSLGRQRAPQHDEGPHMVPYLRAANVKDGTLDLTDVKEMNFTPSEQAIFELRPGDVLVTEGSGSIGAVGASAVWAGEITSKVCFQNTLLRLRPRRDTDPRFLAWWCRYAFGDGLFASIATGANIYHISAERVRAIPVRYLPLARQKTIADFLDVETAHIDTLVAKQYQLMHILRERRAAVVLAAVDGRYTSTARQNCSSVPWMSAMPEGWRAAKLTLIAKLGSGHTPSRERPEWWDNCTVPWVTTGEVVQIRDDRVEYLNSTREKISEMGMANSSATLHPKNTVVLSRTASAGYSAIIGEDMATSQDFVTWTCGPLLEPRFLLLCLRAMRVDLLNRLAQGSTHKTIYMPDVESIKIPLPPLPEQCFIVDEAWRRFRRVDGLVDRLDRQISLLRERRQALITAAVTGELAIPGAAA